MTVVLREDDFAFRLEPEIARSGNAIAARWSTGLFTFLRSGGSRWPR